MSSKGSLIDLANIKTVGEQNKSQPKQVDNVRKLLGLLSY